MLKTCIIIIVTISAFYIYLCLYMYVSQEKILFLIQHPDEKYYRELKQQAFIESLAYSPENGITLHGWRQKYPERPLTILYFWGNAEDISYFLGDVAYSGANIISFNYRWYGESEGKPSEKVLFSDALQIYDFLTQKEKLSPENLVIMGRSLWSGVATYLASERQVRQVILVTPYDSLVRVAQEQYPFIPASLLLRHRFDSFLYAQKQNNSVLCIFWGKDTVIPNARTQWLIEKWNGTVKSVFIPEANHSDILTNPISTESVNTFLFSKNNFFTLFLCDDHFFLCSALSLFGVCSMLVWNIFFGEYIPMKILHQPLKGYLGLSLLEVCLPMLSDDHSMPAIASELCFLSPFLLASLLSS